MTVAHLAPPEVARRSAYSPTSAPTASLSSRPSGMKDDDKLLRQIPFGFANSET